MKLDEVTMDRLERGVACESAHSKHEPEDPKYGRCACTLCIVERHAMAALMPDILALLKQQAADIDRLRGGLLHLKEVALAHIGDDYKARAVADEIDAYLAPTVST